MKTGATKSVVYFPLKSHFMFFALSTIPSATFLFKIAFYTLPSPNFCRKVELLQLCTLT